MTQLPRRAVPVDAADKVERPPEPGLPVAAGSGESRLPAATGSAGSRSLARAEIRRNQVSERWLGLKLLVALVVVAGLIVAGQLLA